MLSFIVIGQNEGRRISLCFDSILNVIAKDNIIDYELIYVDSKSTDDSIERAKKYNNVKVFLITGECNAAIARNIGAKEAQGEILFFIDGDMEILPGFLPTIMKNGKLDYPFVSGIYEDVRYNESWEYVNISRRYKLTEGMQDSFESVTGGLFLINNELWQEIGGMDTRLARSQDLDLGLRLYNKGIPLCRKSQLLAKHHTQNYAMRKNYVKYVKYTALLFRKHMTHKQYLYKFFSFQYTSIVLLMVLIFSWVHIIVGFGLSLVYVFVLFYKTISISNKEESRNWIQILLRIIKRDFFLLFSFLFYFPNPANENYKEILY